jgi:hypothetical protein
MRILLAFSTSILLMASTVQAAKPLPSPPPAPPDLTISAFAITSPAVVHCGPQQLIIFNVTETNLGAGPSGPYFAAYSSNGVGFCFPQRPGLAAGASATFTDFCTLNNGPCTCFPATYTIPFFAFVDAASAIAETNEANNQSQTIIQPAQCP